MSVIKIEDFRDRIEEVIGRAEAGETILIEKDGRTVARLEGLEGGGKTTPIEPFDWDAHRRFLASQPMQTEPAGEFIRRMRDEERY